MTMRTNVVLDDNLMQTALELSGYKTKKKAIEEGLKLLVQLNRQKKIRGFRGKLRWTGDLDKMRTDK
jgi:Arc/MetJ family transcription regulator